MPPPKHIAVLLFPGFQLLDATGPLDILNTLSRSTPLRLSILAATLEPVSTQIPVPTPALSSLTPPGIVESSFAQAIIPTHTFDNAPDGIEVLIVPGGFGSRAEEGVQGVVEFVQSVYPKLRWLLTVCTGSAIVAKTSVLDGRSATSNKKAFEWVKAQNENVNWVAKARWVVDGNIWTSSGVAAGMDMTYAWVESVWGREVAEELADSTEYERNRDSKGDRFAERWATI
ncbi:ThiJ/PfpI family protein [Bimuria novae-zelandiae CBS 107.79]|uniref:ThiJ/PfpI family protein n=1 Tax=Bimuria novae-zelandiae CBS 107.79 TaxID=1447943 RepID=A0A6A5V362_9PLEO|nr:ThiJ/PfpI family protein [Bimuria novae-zelandiae CBS 107.79]